MYTFYTNDIWRDEKTDLPVSKSISERQTGKV
jgi:hypothetical protein